ncbi:glycerol uptake facilitator protein [Methanohalophilus euhalobius]|uniref:Glycerol uptake facilitator protein n=1 Tax=Methanohalophilus euhalobius TaxID=51203 RepID=A0A285EY18_9EURY|nr:MULTISPECIES: MIP/aquaporin family protein [Methanohalophilus]ODV50615.1 MAG: MIP family channel protein [Methanohalophilus sp. 2-GBenrich]RSD33142.1 MAG: MIP family channel protein [Methanohalophilus sp.]TCL12666.1 glycerol uptake facilitator protein [Methanohalophilus euhalobius]SNY03909.1 glycerol uptake facilitator protein [Methanohalophilus euhalobius]
MSEISLFKRSIAELIGTYVLVFLGTGSVVTAMLLVQGANRIPENSFNVGLNIEAWFAIGIAFAIAIIAMIYAFGHISGTHINPAVSIALWATGRFPAKDMMGYIVAQLIGASLASFTIVAILGSRAVDTGLGATAMFDGVSYSQAILCEAVATFFLMLTIMGSAVDKRAPAGFAGLAIGLVVAADIIVVGNITGSSLNPARTFGPYLAEFMLGGTNFWWQFPIYIIGPIVGALVAAFVYDYVTELKSCE